MLLKAAEEYGTITAIAESCLRELPFVYQRNGTNQVTEFEIVRPAYFRVVIEPDRTPKTWNLFMPSIKAPTGSTVDIRLGLDSTPEETKAASEGVKTFLRALVKGMPVEPWKGLSAQVSSKQEKKWKEQMR